MFNIKEPLTIRASTYSYFNIFILICIFYYIFAISENYKNIFIGVFIMMIFIVKYKHQLIDFIIIYFTTLKIIFIDHTFIEYDLMYVDGGHYFDETIILINDFWGHLLQSRGLLSWSYEGISQFYAAYALFLGIECPSTSSCMKYVESIITLNHLLIMISAFLWLGICKRTPAAKITAILIIISPESFIFSLYYGKETIILFLALLALNAFNTKGILSKFIFCACIILGSMGRIYFIVLIIAYLVYFRRLNKSMTILVSLLGITTFIYFLHSRNIIEPYIVLRNFLTTLFGFYLSPNFLRPSNWYDYPFHLFSWVIIIYFYIFSVIKRPRIAKYYLYPLLIAVFLYALPVALVSIDYAVTVDDSNYGFFLPRTRFPLIPIFFMAFSELYLIAVNHSKARLDFFRQIARLKIN
jgi:hypothetical protein